MLTSILIVFIIGYALIAFEQYVKVNKAAIALLTGVICWTLYVFHAQDLHLINEQLAEHIGEIAGILFFLMGAMTIVELIDAHDGFDVITSAIKTTSNRKLLWIISLLAFFLSAVLDNLTTAIVMVTLLRKITDNKNERLLFVGMIIIAANAGGAWSPIGDVTTSMLWIGGQVTAMNLVWSLFLPSVVCLLVPLGIATFMLKGDAVKPIAPLSELQSASRFDKHMILFSGLVILLLVPVFKMLTGLPPFMGMLLGLGLLWVVSEMLHKDKDEADKSNYSVLYALRRIDMPSVLFFLGILISISALQSTGQLTELAAWMDERIGNINIIVLTTGLLSAIVDNVPLVAAAIGMYDMQQFPADHYFWEFLAYCAGTGGSILIIGSAAGVAAMGMEKIDFLWYLKKISWLALAGYLAGAFLYMLLS